MIRTTNPGRAAASLWMPALVVAALFAVAGSANAQSLNALEAVCKNGLFRVEWSGPNAAGDRIALVDPNDSSGQPIAAQSTADGNPLWLRAPSREGEFELRYLPAGSLDALADREIIVGDCSEDSPEDSPNRALLLTGTQIDFGTVPERNGQSPYGGPTGFTIDDICQNSAAIGWAFGTIIGNVESAMAGAGVSLRSANLRGELESAMAEAGRPMSFAGIEDLPNALSQLDIENKLATAREELCDAPPPRTTVQPFVISYASCRMTMMTPSHAMDIHLPPGGGGGTMSMADHGSAQVMTTMLRRDAEALENVTGSGWSSGVSMSSIGGSRVHAGFPVSQYQFKYTAGLSRGSGGALAPIATMITATNEGTAWMADDVPGIGIVQSFYRNLVNEVSISGGASSFFGGLVNSLVGMLNYGLPLDIEQEVKSKVLGVTTVSGRSRNIISDLWVIDIDPQWCFGSIMPTEYEVTDIDAQLNEAMGAAGNSDPETQEAMQEYQQAMEQMTPEQRAMMEQMGMGDMMNQMGGAGSAAAASSASTGSTSASMPSSKELMADDLTESVQNHLEALGYEPRDASGDRSLHTMIAISQFQADKGLDVTGEVTPQLIGILSAEVDSRR
jgi:peptidoglycan hydrolase-like protein with peptidoglycan-binding domain